MRQLLKIHPESRCATSLRLDVLVMRPQPARLDIRYLVSGDVCALRMPPVTAATRVDGLWQHTCFEVFVRAPLHGAYYEFNFAPSLQWAAYRFGGYRSAKSDADLIRAPQLEARADSTSYELKVLLDLPQTSDLPNDTTWQLGLSAVIEGTSGDKSYWALAHPSAQPDFHHPDSFALELPAA